MSVARIRELEPGTSFVVECNCRGDWRELERVEGALSETSRGGREVVLLVRSNVRRFVSELVRASLPKVHVLSYGEVTGAGSIETQQIVRMEN